MYPATPRAITSAPFSSAIDSATCTATISSLAQPNVLDAPREVAASVADISRRVALSPGITPPTPAASSVAQTTKRMVRGLAVKSTQNGISFSVVLTHVRRLVTVGDVRGNDKENQPERSDEDACQYLEPARKRVCEAEHADAQPGGTWKLSFELLRQRGDLRIRCNRVLSLPQHTKGERRPPSCRRRLRG